MSQRWPISEEMRALIMVQMEEIATTGKTSIREKLGAAKVLLEADRLNMAQEQFEKECEIEEHIEELERHAGIREPGPKTERNGTVQHGPAGHD